MANDRILFVDDEANVLAAIKRQLHKQFALTTLQQPQSALKLIEESGPFAVIVSDMRMPEMDGIRFLVRAREIAPDSVRIMLTGNADQQTAIEAVNEGHIFRFLNKPCDTERLVNALNAGLEQHRLIRAEKDLLSETLNGSVRVLTDVLELANPTVYGRASRVCQIAITIGKKSHFSSVVCTQAGRRARGASQKKQISTIATRGAAPASPRANANDFV
jgi:DNA-binding NtrC family response regulator